MQTYAHYYGKTLEIRSHADISDGYSIATYRGLTKTQARTIAKQHNAQPWNF